MPGSFSAIDLAPPHLLAGAKVAPRAAPAARRPKRTRKTIPMTLKRISGKRISGQVWCLAILSALGLGLFGAPVVAQDEEKPYSITEDGVIDWYTYSGFRRYHSECHVCHGPDGLGSSFAPALLESMNYKDFLEVVVNGRENVGVALQSKMPAFGENVNVMCFVDDIYAYLKARADGVIGRGRPRKKQAKPQDAKERDAACMG